jgi:hypothetical protein
LDNIYRKRSTLGECRVRCAQGTSTRSPAPGGSGSEFPARAILPSSTPCGGTGGQVIGHPDRLLIAEHAQGTWSAREAGGSGSEFPARGMLSSTPCHAGPYVRISNATFRYKSVSWYKTTFYRSVMAPIPNTFGSGAVFPARAILLSSTRCGFRVSGSGFRGHGLGFMGDRGAGY